MDLVKKDDEAEEQKEAVGVTITGEPIQDRSVEEERDYLQRQVDMHEAELKRLKTELSELPGAKEPPPGHTGLWPPVRIATKEEIEGTKKAL